MISYPKNIRLLFKRTEELDRYRGFGIDTDKMIQWPVERSIGLRLAVSYPDNFRVIVEHPDNSTLISAVLCTCSGREHFIPRAIQEFNNQTWGNKELIIINQGRRWHSKESDSIREVQVPYWYNNGAMRNVGDALSRGKYIIRVDDDDLYHPDRFKLQIEAIQTTGSPASTLRNIINYVPTEDVAWTRQLKASPGLMMYKNEGHKYIEDIRKSTDTYFMTEWYGGQVTAIDNPPEHYIRVFHGKNQLTNRRGLGEWNLEPGTRKNETNLKVDWDYFEKRKNDIPSIISVSDGRSSDRPVYT